MIFYKQGWNKDFLRHKKLKEFIISRPAALNAKFFWQKDHGNYMEKDAS
jgi:hypothetical protein